MQPPTPHVDTSVLHKYNPAISVVADNPGVMYFEVNWDTLCPPTVGPTMWVNKTLPARINEIGKEENEKIRKYENKKIQEQKKLIDKIIRT